MKTSIRLQEIGSQEPGLRHGATGHGRKKREEQKGVKIIIILDFVISDLLGLKPKIDNVIEINPLIPDNWDWFCLDRILYHEKEITIIWDKTGEKYKKGKGLMVFIDGELRTKTDRIEKIICEL